MLDTRIWQNKLLHPLSDAQIKYLHCSGVVIVSYIHYILILLKNAMIDYPLDCCNLQLQIWWHDAFILCATLLLH